MRLRNTRDIGFLLQSRRKTLGWSQVHLASQLGITRQWVIALEKGTPGVAVGTVVKAFTALGLMLDANPRKAGGDAKGMPGLINSDIDDVIESARSGTSENLSVSRQSLPLSRSRRKTRGES